MIHGRVKAFFLVLALALVPQMAGAVLPDEILADPKLEARARDISEGLRCLVCQNESIDDSNADLARDLRIIVRERLQAGDTDEQVVSYITARYGDYVLLKPPFNAETFILWGSPALFLLFGAGAILLWFRGRRQEAEEAGTLANKALTQAERDRLKAILDEDK
ncbi:cytochrome c-type biogenesis protein [Aestuariispira ectoiniformans]|uniref:cytochrome c-type biogenesis protein n=1 Tax=Aestuariispira ectoiniformans TaxID=2775080 RepID=UPI00223BAC43|nr:cytochrome c-type biogenesis protein [Aestuariispira ectoiniformans]